MTMSKMYYCPACGGDGKETCNNPDHGFISSVAGEIGRLGCPVCGHDENHKVRCWDKEEGKYKYHICTGCNGKGVLTLSEATRVALEWNYDDYLIEVEDGL